MHSNCAKTYFCVYKFPPWRWFERSRMCFKEKRGVPQCAGSTDGSRVPVTPPVMNHTTDYYNRKGGWYSMLLQAVVDHNCLIRDLCIGWPGRVHDAQTLANNTGARSTTVNISNRGWLVKPFSVVKLTDTSTEDH